MSSYLDSVKSTAVVLYNPTLPHISKKAHLESVSNEVARRSLENAKYGANHFPQVSPKVFTGRNFVHFKASVNTPRCLKTDSCIDIEIFAVAPGDRKSPVFIFSHGYGAHPVKYRPFLGELASHGYTVLSLTHRSSIEEIPGLTPEEETERMDQLAGIMVNNIQYVLGKVRHGALKDLGDPNRIILGGHSLGGAASIIVSRNDSAILGCLNLDGFLKGKATKTDGLAQPLLMLIGDYQADIHELEQDPEEEAREYARYMSQSLEEYETLRRNSPHSEKIVIPGAVHMDFTDQPFRDYVVGDKTLSSAMKVHTIASREVLKFLEFCLSDK